MANRLPTVFGWADSSFSVALLRSTEAMPEEFPTELLSGPAVENIDLLFTPVLPHTQIPGYIEECKFFRGPFQFEDRRQDLSHSENAFHRLPKFQGLFYEPGGKQGPKKHQCPDCQFCQECSPSRCSVCRGATPESGCKMSLQEQVALYEQINTEP